MKTISKTSTTRKKQAADGDLKFHPYANIFPLLGAEELGVLSKDIADNGLRSPITIYEGMILDGRNRQTACVMANITPQYVGYDGADAVKFVVSTNLHRRHLNESQRAMVAAKLANMPLGGAGYRCAILRTDSEVSQTEAATLLNTSRRAVQQAKKVETEAIPEVVAAVESGKLCVCCSSGRRARS